MRRRQGGAGLRRGTRACAKAVAGGSPTLEAQILAAAADGGLTVGGLFLAQAADLTLGAGDRVSNWVNHGVGGDAVQGTDASRPTYGATSLNSKPGLFFDGGDALITAAMNSGTATSYAIIQALSRSAGSFAASFGDITSGAGFALKASPAGAQCLAGGTTSRAEAASAVSAATVAASTVDTTLVGGETEIRLAGSNVTSTRPVDGNVSGSVGSAPITIGARQGPANQLTGVIGACVVLWGAGAWSGSRLTALAAIETLIATEWGL